GEDELGGDEDPTPREAVHQRPRHEREEQERPELEGPEEPEPERRVGQLEDQPGLRDRLHPGAELGDDLGAEELAEVPVVESSEARRERHRAAGLVATSPWPMALSPPSGRRSRSGCRSRSGPVARAPPAPAHDTRETTDQARTAPGEPRGCGSMEGRWGSPRP